MKQFVIYKINTLRTAYICHIHSIAMALTPQQLMKLVKLRALGWSQTEIAEELGVSQQVVGYNLKKLKRKSQESGIDQVFNSALIGGLAGAATGIGILAIMELLKNEK